MDYEIRYRSDDVDVPRRMKMRDDREYSEHRYYHYLIN